MSRRPHHRTGAAIAKTYKVALYRDGSTCFIPVTFDPKAVFGKLRAPVKVTLGGHTYRSTIASMGGGPCIPLRKSNREAAGLEGTETLEVRLELDEEPRVVEPPADLVKALRSAGALARWGELSYSHQREHVEAIAGAKRPETRSRRIAAAVAMVGAAPARAKPRPKAPAKPSAPAKQPARRPARQPRNAT